MDLQAHYAALIDRQYRRLANPGRLHWRWATRLFSRSDSQVLWLCRGVSMAVWAALIGAGTWALMTYVEGIANERSLWLGWLCAVALLLQFFVMVVAKALNAGLRRKSALPATDHLEDLTRVIAVNPRLFDVVKDMLKRDGVAQLTQAQASFLWKGFAPIERWQAEEVLRQRALEKLNTTGVVTLARNEQRSECLDVALPAPTAGTETTPRF